jgi:predicted PurR-regulated permease PerM
MPATGSSKIGNLYVPRVVSFIVLLAIILLVGIVFFQVMAQFIVPLFLACVLLVIFQPLHRWFLGKLPKWPRIAALLTTITIMLTVLVPTIYLGWNAYLECANRIEAVQQKSESKRQSEPVAQAKDASENTLYARLSAKADEWAATLKEKTGLTIEKEPAELLEGAVAWVGGLLPLVAGAAIRILVGLLIMIVALYYFLADGPAMINGLMGLSPMDRRHELELLARFAEISRSVVLATLLSAVVQGILAGIGFYFALPSGAPIFLLTALTMVLAIVPFVGAAGVWVPTCAIIFLFGEQVFVVGGEATDGGNWQVALALAVYCAVIVSGIDNVIKPLVLHGQANLHPLLALLSILGGIQVLGPVGILIGPMLVSFLQALLSMFRRELERWEDPTQRSLVLSPGAQALAETIDAAVEAAEGDDASEKPSLTKGVKSHTPKKKGR